MTANVNPTIAWLCATTIIVAILLGIFVLVYHGSFKGDEVLPVISGIATASLGMFGVHAGVSAGAKAAKATPKE